MMCKSNSFPICAQGGAEQGAPRRLCGLAARNYRFFFAMMSTAGGCEAACGLAAGPGARLKAKGCGV